MPGQPWRQSATWIVLAAVYALAGKLGLALAFVNPSATAVWPPTGIALAAVVAFGPRVWPGIFLGAFLTNETTAGTLATSLLIAAGNTLEALLGGYFVTRFAGARSVFDTGRGIFLFALFAGLVSTGVSATIGVTTLSLFGFGPWPAYWPTWLTWWLGDASGAMVVAPALLLWKENPRIRWSRPQAIELFALLLALAGLGWIIFVVSRQPIGFLCIPLCLWAACRFGQREAATAICLLSAIAIWGSLHGLGAFGARSVNDTLLLLQAFMIVTSIVGITVGAAVSGRRIAEGRLRLANAELEYRVNDRTRELEAALDELRASDARFAEAQHVANVGSWEWTLADNSESWSEELYRICGFEPYSFHPTFESFLQLLHPDDRERVSGVIQRAREDHQPFDFEHRIVRPNGDVRTLSAWGRVVLDVGGRVVRMVGTAQDITSRKATEEILSRSERRLQTIIDAEPACVKLISPDGLLLEMNRAGLEMIGVEDLSQLVGKPVIDLVHPADRARFGEAHRAAGGGSPGRLEFRILAPAGERWVDSHLVPFDMSDDAREGPSAVLIVTSDVTERKNLEDQLRQGQKMEAIGQLAGGVAHDFNNLLTAIGGYTELVLASVDRTDPRHADLVEVRKAAERAATLTGQLLAFSRRQMLQASVLDLNELVAGIHKLLRRTIPEHIELVLALDPLLENVRADRGQLEQIVLNLAVNAGDAMPQGGQLRLATKMVDVDTMWARHHAPMTAGRYVRLGVSDTGTGMSPETQSRIFEPFFTTKGLGKGTGLGLATVYGIVKQSGGFIWVSSELQHGTTFEIYLPAVHEPVESALPAKPVTQPVSGSETILVAEDDGGVRRLARDVLRKYSYTVLEARDGEEALSIAQHHGGAIQLLMTDVVMPGLSGRDLGDRISAIRPGIRVLYTSGYAENITTGAGLARGLPFLAKPYSPAELLYKVRDILDTNTAGG